MEVSDTHAMTTLLSKGNLLISME